MARDPRTVGKVSSARPSRGRIRQRGDSKRTLVVSLLVLGAGAASVAYYMSRGEKTDNRIFKSLEQCKKESSYPAGECETQFKAAKAAHEKNAPLFPSKAACEQEFDKCENPSRETGRSSYFMPAMMGYLIGRHAGRGFQSAPLFRRAGDAAGRYRQMAPFPRPVARTGSGTSSASRASRSAFRSRTWTSSGSRSSARVYRPSSSRISRGGFGRSSRGFSGG